MVGLYQHAVLSVVMRVVVADLWSSRNNFIGETNCGSLDGMWAKPVSGGFFVVDGRWLTHRNVIGEAGNL